LPLKEETLVYYALIEVALYNVLVNNFFEKYSRENTDWVSVDNSLEDQDYGDVEKALDMWEDLVKNWRVTPKRIEGAVC